MGNDNRFYSSDASDLNLISGESWSPLYFRNGLFGVFWLACFRQDDLKLLPFDEEGGTCFLHYVCPADKARNQFDKGLRTLKAHFPRTDFDYKDKDKDVSWLDEFRFELNQSRRHVFHMAILQAECDEMYSLLLPALIGFDYPDSIFPFSSSIRNNWSSRSCYPPPDQSGVMTWGGVIRRLCLSTQDFTLSEFDSASNVGSLGDERVLFQDAFMGGYGV